MDFAAITLFFFFFFVAGLQASAQNQSVVPIKVFYETLCPDSRNFIVGDLASAYKKFGSALDIEFVPFGKAHSASNNNFVCQHGPPECRGNMIDCCVLHRLPKGASQVDYVVCRMAAFSPDSSQVQQCVENAGISWSDILACSNSSEGVGLMLEAEQETRQYTPGPNYVPTVVFDDNYNNQYQQEIERGGLNNVLCNDYQLC